VWDHYLERGAEASPKAAPVSLTLRDCSLIGRLPLWPPISDLAWIQVSIFRILFE
jgi:hypothetical protein